MLVKVFAIVHRNLIVGGQQILQHVDYHTLASNVSPTHVSVSRGNGATTSLTHSNPFRFNWLSERRR
jgi:hypothetical protein